MYRSSSEYDRLDKLAIDLFVDYKINTFPVDERLLCKKMGILLIPYSAYDNEQRKLLNIQSSEGFLSYGTSKLQPIIFYNDCGNAIYGNIRQTIFHEIKHFIDEDVDDEQDDLAEHFGRYLTCPTPYLIWKNITDVNEIISTFGVSASIAYFVSTSVKNRIKRYGSHIFDYEVPLINLFR